MSYTVPQFNLVANVYRLSGGVYSLVGTVPCNLAIGRRIGWLGGDAAFSAATSGFAPTLLVPKLSDVRDASCGVGPDVVEVPSGSSRWYAVLGVDDVGKGFSNEHRACNLFKVGWYEPWLSYGFTAWPAPIP